MAAIHTDIQENITTLNLQIIEFEKIINAKHYDENERSAYERLLRQKRARLNGMLHNRSNMI